MATNFPGANDTFDVPASPTTAALGTTGGSARTHTQHHQDIGDAIIAMQAQATYKAHIHDGATFRNGNQLLQANTHQSPDTDAGTTSLHHTIGAGANQYASGTHTHAAVATYPVGAFFFAWMSTYPGVTDPGTGNPGLGVIGTWTAVGQRFLCATGGSLGFALGDTGGSNSHNHTMDALTNTQTAHSHTLSSATTGGGGNHTHTNSGGTTATSVSHYHITYDGGQHVVGSGSGASPYALHYHQYNSHTASHSHSAPTTGSQADHTHNLPSTALGNSSTHNHNNSTPQTANTLLPLFVVYVWQRTA